MRLRGRRAGLWQEQGCQEEGVIGDLDDPDLTLTADPAHSEPALLEPLPVVGVHPVVAVVVLRDLRGSIESGSLCPREDSHRLALTHQRARQRGDDEPFGIGARLGVVGVPEPENVARELDDRVLEATSGADERNPALSRVAYGRERSVHAAVGTGGRDPEPVVLG
jgi:hypothetical protein